MIELRWLEHTVPLPHDPNIGQTVRVLQYRYDRHVDHLAIGMAAVGARWTDWQDVPTVREA